MFGLPMFSTCARKLGYYCKYTSDVAPTYCHVYGGYRYGCTKIKVKKFNTHGSLLEIS